ncbi:putative integral membrane protein [Priestia megaterium Q3]|uniref:Putative integral membrane protein n=1 Tax=Priestia megaterium Q3 TaxID=1452722 RepID=A0A806U2A4_PRIMG|nr:VanZ family protein [Priestia megaterium]AKP76093.1 putative integral membrane protein [Priestia megaterium Q3]
MSKRNSINVLFLVSILFIIRLTMFPESLLGIGEGKGGINLVPFFTIADLLFHHSFGDFILNNIGNIMLFLPFGFFLPMRCEKINKLPKSLLVGMAFSVFIEIVQLFMPNRWTDVDDVLLNTLGTGIGYSLFKVLNQIEIYMKEG